MAGQAGEYFDALPERDRPRHILVSDFQMFELRDLDERETVSLSLSELPGHVAASTTRGSPCRSRRAGSP